MSFYLLVFAARLGVLLQLLHGPFELLRTEGSLKFLSFPAERQLTSLLSSRATLLETNEETLKIWWTNQRPEDLMRPSMLFNVT